MNMVMQKHTTQKVEKGLSKKFLILGYFLRNAKKIYIRTNHQRITYPCTGWSLDYPAAIVGNG